MKNISFILFIFLLGGCGPSEKKDAHLSEENSHEDHGDEHVEDEVHLTAGQIQVTGIQLTELKELPMKNMIKANGHLDIPPQNRASISPIVGGKVKRILVIQGQKVEENEVLAYLEHPDYIHLQEDYLEAKSKLHFLKKDYERKKSLLKDSIGSEREFQEISGDYFSLSGRVKALESRIRLLGLNPANVEEGSIASSVPLRSPIGGYVQKVKVNIGQYISSGNIAFQVVDNHHIHVDLMVYESDIHKIRKGQKVLFRYTNQPREDYYEATIFAVGKAFEEEQKAIDVHAEIENESHNLIPGMYVEARIVTDSAKLSVLPLEAIVREEGQEFVFLLIKKPEKENKYFIFKKTPVTTGAEDQGLVAVKFAGRLPKDAMFAGHGAFYLDSELKKGEGGHHH